VRDDGDAEVIDARASAAFVAGHVPGALANAWRPAFATWLGWLVDRTRGVVLVVDDTVPVTDLAWAAATAGYDRLVGVLAGGMDAWRAEDRPVATIPLVPATHATGRRIVDVRRRSEHLAGRVGSSLVVGA
jgi:hydroxyacylglutathione hydrolase